MRIMKAVGLSVLGLSIGVAGCSKESKQTQPVQSQSDAGASKAPESSAAANQRGEALVRVVNAASNMPAIEVMAEQQAAFPDVKAKEVTAYKPIPASADKFTIKPAMQESAQPLAENSESITSGRHYTLVVFPEPAAKANADGKTETNEKVSLEVIADDLVPPSAGKARVRVINAAPATDDVAVYLKGQDDALFSDVDFKEAVSYKDVDPIKTTIEMRTSTTALRDVNPKTGERTDATTPARDRTDTVANAAHQPGAMIGSHSVDFEAGKSYTIVLVGGKTAHRLDTLVVEDVVPLTSTPTN